MDDDEDYNIQEYGEPNGHEDDAYPDDDDPEEKKLYDSDDNSSVSDFTDDDKILGDDKQPDDDEDEEPEVVEDKPAKKRAVRRITLPLMTKFEYSYLISQRAMMIENNSPLMIPDTIYTNSIDIAREETEKGVNPIIIVRKLPNGNIEEWKCIELQLPRIL
jgi:DNA-directed RNA polymerase subunit K/omega